MPFNTAEVIAHLKVECRDRARQHLRPRRAQHVTRDEVLNGNFVANNYLVGILYKVTHFNHDNVLQVEMQQRKKMKKGYDRIFFMSDGKGGTFCIVTQNEQKSRAMCCLCVADIAVGQMYVLPHVKTNDGSTLQNDMPVLEFKHHFFPLMDSFIDHLSPIPVSKPDVGKETNFFLLKNAQMLFHNVLLIGKGDTYPPCCNGKFCDRTLRLKSNKEACGCFSMNSSTSSIVIEADIQHVCEDDTSKSFIVFNHRSLRTTQLFIENYTILYTNSSEMRASYAARFEDAVESCCDYINNNGGFTVMGTCSRGEISDISNVHEKIASTRVTHGITYIQPTNLSILNQPEYIATKFNAQEAQANLLDANGENRFRQNNDVQPPLNNPAPNNPNRDELVREINGRRIRTRASARQNNAIDNEQNAARRQNQGENSET